MLQTNGTWIIEVPWLAAEDPTFLVEVILALRPAVFAPDETVRSSALHIVLSGLAICGGRLLRHGSVWGTDMLLAAAHLRSRTLVRAITYVEVSYLDRDTTLRIASQHSESLDRIRRQTRLLALRRFVVLIAKASVALGRHQKKVLAQVGAPASGPSAPSAAFGRAYATGGALSPEGSPSRKLSTGECRSMSRRDAMGTLHRQNTRWRSAVGLCHARRAAEASFARRQGLGTAPANGRDTMPGTELDHRLEASREEKLCGSLFDLAAVAHSAAHGLAALGAPTSQHRAARSPPAAVSAATAPSAPSAPPPPPQAAATRHPDASSSTAPPPPERQPSRQVVFDQHTVSSTCPCTSVLARAGVTPSMVSHGGGANGQRATAAEGPPPAKPVATAASATPFAQSSTSFLRRRLGGRTCSEGKFATESEGRADGEDDERGAPQVGRPARRLRANPSAMSRSRLSTGFEALNTRVDELFASHEAMRNDVAQLVQLLTHEHTNAGGRPSGMTVSSGGNFEAALIA